MDANNALTNKVEFAGNNVEFAVGSALNANSSIAINAVGDVDLYGSIKTGSTFDVKADSVATGYKSKTSSKGSVKFSGDRYVWVGGDLSTDGNLELRSLGVEGMVEILNDNLFVGGDLVADSSDYFYYAPVSAVVGDFFATGKQLYFVDGETEFKGNVNITSNHVGSNYYYEGIEIANNLTVSGGVIISAVNSGVNYYGNISANSVSIEGYLVDVDGVIKANTSVDLSAIDSLRFWEHAFVEVDENSLGALNLNSARTVNWGTIKAPTIMRPEFSEFFNIGTVLGNEVLVADATQN